MIPCFGIPHQKICVYQIAAVYQLPDFATRKLKWTGQVDVKRPTLALAALTVREWYVDINRTSAADRLKFSPSAHDFFRKRRVPRDLQIARRFTRQIRTCITMEPMAVELLASAFEVASARNRTCGLQP